MYLPVYKSNPRMSQPHIFKPKNEFFLFLGNNFLEKLTFYLKIFSQVPYGYTKKIVLNFFYLSFWPMYKSRAIFGTDFYAVKG